MNDTYRVVLFNSRNKDNKDIENFRQRSKSFLTLYNKDKIFKEFQNFVKEGQAGETSRLYVSVNQVDYKSVMKEFTKFLIDKNFDYEPHKVMTKLASLGSLKENKLTKHWLFDFDSADADLYNEFFREVREIAQKGDSLCWFKEKITPNGWHLVVSHGFDTRELMKKWGDIVELKRDAMLLNTWSLNC